MPGKDERPISRFATREAERTIPIARAAEGGLPGVHAPGFRSAAQTRRYL